MADRKKITEEELRSKIIDTVLGVDGVSDMSSTFTDSLKSLPGLGSPQRGVRISFDNEEFIFDIFINVKYRVKIPQLAWDIQTCVKQTIGQILNVKIKEVNIHVQGVDLPKEENNQ